MVMVVVVDGGCRWVAYRTGKQLLIMAVIKMDALLSFLDKYTCKYYQ